MGIGTTGTIKQMPKKNTKSSKKNMTKKKVEAIVSDMAETKIIKDIQALSASSPTLSGEVNWYTPYFNTAHATWNDAFNPTLTDGGYHALDFAVKDFISSGINNDQRIGRTVHIDRVTSNLILSIEPTSETLHDYPQVATFRVVQGWVKNGVNELNDLHSAITHIYDEFDWTQYHIKKDYLIKRSAKFSGLTLGATEHNVPTYGEITIKTSFRPDRKVSFSGPTVTASATPPCHYTGWAPFVYVFNQHHAYLDLKVQFQKRVIRFKDL